MVCSQMRYILGITHKFSYNQTACLLGDGKLIAFAEEERFTRVKQAPHDFPARAIDFCLNEAGIGPEEIAKVGVGYSSIQDIWKVVSSHEFARYANKGFERIEFDRGADLEIYYEADWVRDICQHNLPVGHIHWQEHHDTHIASTVACAPFDSCNYMSIDGDGGQRAGSVGFFNGKSVDEHAWFHCIGSIGTFYEKVTDFLGFTPHREEGKTMGLASYGQYDEKLIPREVFFRNEGGLLQIDRNTIEEWLGVLKEEKGEEIQAKGILSEVAVNIAHTAQKYLEEIFIDTAKIIHDKTSCRDFALTGGSVLNCSANGRLLEQDFVDNIFVHPASHDAGTALGAALMTHYQERGWLPKIDFPTAYWGSKFNGVQIEHAIKTFCSKEDINLHEVTL